MGGEEIFYLIRAVIRREKTAEVLKALSSRGYRGATVYDARGMGGEGGVVELNGGRIAEALIPRSIVEVAVDSSRVDDVIKIILEASRTGEIGDGRIFVIPMSMSIRIRTGEKTI